MSPASLTIQPGPLRGGSLIVPGDKSISHRALILAALAEGESCIHGLLESSDCLATAAALRQLGVSIESGSLYRISGAGPQGLRASTSDIDCGNSGTAMRLLAGVLAGQPFESVLTGDDSLSSRPMQRVAEPLNRMGAQVACSTSGTAPLRIRGRRELRAIEYRLPVASAQVKSAILLAGLRANGTTHVIEPDASRDHTERMLQSFGVTLVRAGQAVSLPSPQRLVSPGAIEVPGDLSSAAFFLVLGSIVPGCRVELNGVGVNPTRDGILDLLKRMGANIAIHNRRETRGGEPVADIRVESAELHGIEVREKDVIRAIDEIPALLIAAACAKGRTVVRGATELRVKESDRLHVMASGLHALGISVDEFEDGIAVEGGRLQGGTVDSGGDHRIAMAFAIGGAVATAPVTIMNVKNIATSYPGFASDAKRLGLNISGTEKQ